MKNRDVILILPSPNPSGGMKIAKEFAKSLNPNYSILYLFNNTKIKRLKIFLIYFYRLIFIAFSILKNRNSYLIITHYSTLPLRIIPFYNFIYFYQDHEYKFINNILFSNLIKILVSLVSTFTYTVSTSKYLIPPFIYKLKRFVIFPICFTFIFKE